MIAICVILSATLLGCQTYDGNYSFANFRTLVHSDAPLPAKIAGAPFLLIPETLLSPVTAYLDAADHPPSTNGHVHWSYLGTRTLMYADMHDVTKLFGVLLTAAVDTIWFPITGTVDIIHSLGSGEG